MFSPVKWGRSPSVLVNSFTLTRRNPASLLTTTMQTRTTVESGSVLPVSLGRIFLKN